MGDPIVACRVCRIEFDDISMYAFHIFSKHPTERQGAWEMMNEIWKEEWRVGLLKFEKYNPPLMARGERYPHCPTCNQSFRTGQALADHIAQTHNNNPKAWDNISWMRYGINETEHNKP